MKMKPFNLEKALAGEKVVNRIGVERHVALLPFPLLDQDQATYTPDGRYSNVSLTDFDLFMAPTIVYKILYKYDDGLQLGFTCYSSAEEAKANANAAYVGTVEIEE